MDDARARQAIEAAGDAIWAPPQFTGEPLRGVAVEDVVELARGGLALGRRGDDVFVAPVLIDGPVARRAIPGDGVITALLAGDRDGSLAFRTVGPPLPVLNGERAVGVDQSNESVVLGERVIVKVFRSTRPGPQPAADLPAHLAAVGFVETPEPYGSVVWRDDTIVATAVAFVPGARDGWEWYVDMLAAAVRIGRWEAIDAVPEAIGGVVARLHRALAVSSAVLPEPRALAARGQIGEWRRRADTTLAEAVALTHGAAGERLQAIADRAREVVARLDAIEATPVQRIHGDLHVGQLLRAGDGPLLVCDFDGNPLAPAAVRTALQATARDVAAMAGAIDHVGRVVQRRAPNATEAIDAWIERSRVAFLRAYREALGDEEVQFDERLLDPFAVEQEAHEFVYAARYLPRWGYVPDAAMPEAISRAEGAR